VRKASGFSYRLTQLRHPSLLADISVTDTFSDTQASVLIGTAEKMIELWERLSPQKQALLLKRFGTQENALAALIATQLVAPL